MAEKKCDCVAHYPPHGNQYAERDIQAQCEHYALHVSHMTSEGLHDKSDIAAELAHRDIRIEELKRALEDLEEVNWKNADLTRKNNELRARLEAAYWDGRADERKEAEAVMEAVRGLQRYHQIPWKGAGYLPQMYESPEGEFVRADELDKALKGGGDG